MLSSWISLPVESFPVLMMLILDFFLTGMLLNASTIFLGDLPSKARCRSAWGVPRSMRGCSTEFGPADRT